MTFNAIIDSLVAGGAILICILISIFARRNDKNTVDDYLLADRKMSVIPVAFSTFATLISANSFTSLVGEVYIDGIQIFVMFISVFFVQIPIAFYIIPVFHNMSYTSVYEYVERRFDKHLRKFYSFIFILVNLFRCGTFLFAPAITITTVTGLSHWIIIVVSGVICSMYCIIGGFRAVVYTDVFQSFLMFASLVLVSSFAYSNIGFQKAWEVTFSGQFHQHFRFYEDLNNSYTVWNLCFYGFMFGFFYAVCSQSTAQRYLCLKDYKTARNSYLLSQIIIQLYNVFLILMAVAIFAATSNCNPMQDPNSGVRLPDQIFIYISAKLLKGYPGSLGFLLAGLISAALSTVSSIINSLAANTLDDFIVPMKPSLQNNESARLLLCKILTGVFGTLTIITALIVPYIGGILPMTFLMIGAFVGPTAAVLCVGFFYRKSSTKACKLAMVISLVFSLWITTGSYLNYPHRPQFVHTKGQECSDFTTNATLLSTNNTYLQFKLRNEERGSYIYGISALWFPVMSSTLAYVLIVIFSRVFGPDKDVDIRLLSPLVLTKLEKEMVERMNYERKGSRLLKCGEKHEMEAIFDNYNL